MHRNLRREFEPCRVGLAIIGGPVVVGPRQRGGIVRREIVMAQDLPPARAVHDGDVDPLDVHRGQGRDRVVAARPRHLEMRMPRPAAAAQLAARHGRALLHVVRRDRQTLHLHAHDRVGVALVLAALRKKLPLPAEKPRRVRPMRPIEVARPEVVGLHHVQIAVENQKTIACHCRFLLSELSCPPRRGFCPKCRHRSSALSRSGRDPGTESRRE